VCNHVRVLLFHIQKFLPVALRYSVALKPLFVLFILLLIDLQRLMDLLNLLILQPKQLITAKEVAMLPRVVQPTSYQATAHLAFQYQFNFQSSKDKPKMILILLT
jgi:hypothetical protein